MTDRRVLCYVETGEVREVYHLEWFRVICDPVKNTESINCDGKWPILKEVPGPVVTGLAEAIEYFNEEIACANELQPHTLIDSTAMGFQKLGAALDAWREAIKTQEATTG